MLKAIILGNITKDIEVKTSSTGKSYTKFAVAVNSGFGETKRTDFFVCAAFGKTAENIGKFFHKGSKILLDCIPQSSRYTNKDGSEVNSIEFIVNSFDFIESKNANNDKNSVAKDDGFLGIPDSVDETDGLPFE